MEEMIYWKSRPVSSLSNRIQRLFTYRYLSKPQGSLCLPLVHEMDLQLCSLHRKAPDRYIGQGEEAVIIQSSHWLMAGYTLP
jgi:hypothetical protein